MFKEKTISMEKAMSLIKDNYKVAFSDSGSEPQGVLSSIHTIAEKVNNVSLWMCLTLRSYPFLENRAYGNRFRINNMYFSKPMRDAADLLDTVSYAPTHLKNTARTLLAQGAPDIFWGSCSLPNKEGKVSLGIANTYSRDVMKHAKLIILEMNRHTPFTYGDTVVDPSEIDYFVETDYPMVQDKIVPVNDKDKIIASNIMEYVKDGDCLQVGIGAIPNSVVQLLGTKKDLGVHTELISDGLADLAIKGVINGSRKTLHKGKMVTSIIIGSNLVYDYVNNNPDVLVMNCSYANQYEVICKNENQVSINTSIEVDLSGQCCSESFGSKQYTGTGGQADTAIGAQMSSGGRSFIALYATANARQADGGRKEVSKIVPQLKSGATVSLQRNDLHHLATEYGVVNVRGLSVSDRAKAIISIAHPSFREELTAQAKELGLITRA